MKEFVIVGKSPPRLESLNQVTGRQVYVDDMSLPRMLHAKAKFSPHSHAKVLKVDVAKAERMPGVKAVITAQDVPNNRYGIYKADQPVIAFDRVRYLGDYVAVVAAVDEETATEAVELIEAEYDELPAIFDPREAMKPDSIKIHEDGNVVKIGAGDHLQIRKGNIEEGFKQADYILEDTYAAQASEHAYLEPHAALAEVDPSGNIRLWTTSQMIFLHVMQIADVLKVPISKIRGIAPVLGGGFGGKNEPTIEMATILLAQKAGQPVKWAWTTAEEFRCSSTAHCYYMTHKTGVKKDGTIVAKKISEIVDNGAYTIYGPWTLDKHCVLGTGPYRVPNYWADGWVVYTNKHPGGALRGFGVRQATLAFELQMDQIARELGIDPLELRLKNAWKEGEVISTGQSVQAVAVEDVLRRVAEMAKWEVKVPFRAVPSGR